MSTDISRWLKEIADIKGVEGVYVVSNRGQIIAHTSLKIESARIETIASRILHIEGAFHRNWSALKEIELVSTEYRIIGMMRENFTILTFCNEEQALSLIRMTLNVVLAHLLEDKKFMKFINKFPVKKTVLLEKAKLDMEETKLISKLQ
jgi:predicted regulator of Ras-like GTPase activity (Roadblock/LC7/MglB family)